jgi:hypothetical protein
VKKSTVKTQKKPNRRKYKQNSKDFAKVYWPYLPVIVFMLIGLPFVSNPKFSLAKRSVLAYATEMSPGALLSSTNAQRTANGIGSLAINAALSQAAQQKANDMVARDYWSHNTPEGNQPWVFIDATGYSYKKAGENLAYGFDTSADTVNGWMNSPSHRANMLDSAFDEVGFGIANSPNYQSNGEMTVVVAMYGDPLSAPTPAPTAAPTPTPQPVLPAQVVPLPAESQAADTQLEPTPSPDVSITPTPATEQDTSTPVGYTTESPRPPTQQQSVSRIDAFAKGKAPWSYYTLAASLVAASILFILKHALAIKRFVIHGESLVINHPLIDVGLLLIIAVAYYATRDIGFIQ